MSGFQAGDDVVFLRDAIGGDHQGNMATDSLLGCVAEEPFGRGVPALNFAAERLADDGVIRGLDDRRQQPRRQQLAGLVLFLTPLRGDVAENQHASGDLPGLVPDWRGAVVDRALDAVFSNQQRVVGQTNDDALPQSLGCGVLHGSTGALVDDPEHAVERLAHGIWLRPPCQRFGHGVQVGDASVDVGCDDRVADAAERDPQQFTLLACQNLGDSCRLAEPDDEGAGEQVRHQPDEIAEYVEAQLAPWLDEEIRAGEVTQDHNDDGRAVAAHPHSCGDGAEQRDERQRVTHQRVEQPPGEQGRCEPCDRKRVGSWRASYAAMAWQRSLGTTIPTSRCPHPRPIAEMLPHNVSGANDGANVGNGRSTVQAICEF